VEEVKGIDRGGISDAIFEDDDMLHFFWGAGQLGHFHKNPIRGDLMDGA
jgi:hypothetical protein